MANTTYNLTKDMNNKLQTLEGKPKLKFYQNISNYYDERNYRRESKKFQVEGNIFSENIEDVRC